MCYTSCRCNTCQNNGQCVVNIQKETKCLCSDDDNFIYYGEICEKKKEKFAVIIAAITGGTAVIILIIVTICCLIKWKHLKKDEQNQEEYINEHDTLSYNHPFGLLSRQRVPSNHYFTHDSPDDGNDFDNRQERLMNSDIHRINTYADTSIPYNSDGRPNLFSKTIVEGEFAIKRPKIRSDGDAFFHDFRRSSVYRPDYV